MLRLVISTQEAAAGSCIRHIANLQLKEGDRVCFLPNIVGGPPGLAYGECDLTSVSPLRKRTKLSGGRRYSQWRHQALPSYSGRVLIRFTPY